MPPIITYETRSSAHVKAFLESAERASTKVTVLSSPPNPATNAAYSSFRRNYFHRSVNPLEFELACFDRYFAIDEFLRGSSINSFVLSDTDILVQRKFEQIESFVEGADVVLSAPTTHARSPKSFMEMSPHFSFWRREALSSFLDFLVQTYQSSEGRGLLNSVADANERISSRASVSDMTLLAIWSGTAGFHVLNGTTIKSGNTIDHNIGISSHALPEQFQMRWGPKRLVSSPEGFYFRTVTGDLIYPYAIHFQGRYKLIMQGVLNNRTVVPFLTSKAISVLRGARAKWLGDPQAKGNKTHRTE